MADFKTEETGGFITDTFSTREEPSAAPEESAEAAPTPETPDTAQPQPVDPFEQRRREQEADYTRKTQAAAERLRQAEALEAEVAARERALQLRAEALKPLETFDTMLANDPNLAATVTPLIQGYKPGQAQPYADEAARKMAQMESSMQQMTVSNAEAFLMQKYPDYAERRSEVAQTMDDLGVKYPGHDIVRVTKQLEAAYRLATQGRTVQAAKTEAERDMARKVEATRLGQGAALGGPTPEPDIPLRRPDGKLASYDDITESLKAQMRGRR